MKKRVSSGSCIIIFEEFDEYAGKEIIVKGERVSGGFHFNGQSLMWLIPDEMGRKRMMPVDEGVRNKLIEYITREGLKQDFKLVLWSK